MTTAAAVVIRSTVGNHVEKQGHWWKNDGQISTRLPVHTHMCARACVVVSVCVII